MTVQQRLAHVLRAAMDHSNGTYIEVRFDKETVKDVITYCKDMKFTDPITEDDVHATVMYSTTGIPTFKPLGKIAPVPITGPRKMELFGEHHDTLVVQVTSKFMTARHRTALALGATPTFPTYKPHITLAYNVKDMDLSSIPVYDGRLVIIEERMEPLDP